MENFKRGNKTSKREPDQFLEVKKMPYNTPVQDGGEGCELISCESIKLQLAVE